LALSCGPKASPPDAAPKHISAEDDILQVAKVWRNGEKTRGARPPPSKIAIFEIDFETTITLVPGKGGGEEHIEVRERFETREGRQFECRAEKTSPIRAKYGRRKGEPAVELSRPPIRLSRQCKPPDFHEPEIQLGTEGSRFLLQDERLVGFQPVGEKRVFLPSD
jgi:hypothetical protein